MFKKAQRTHVKDVEDPDKVLIPGGNLVPIALREDEPEYCAPFTLFRDLPLDPCQGSAIQTLVSGSLCMRSVSLV
jgi:hypothetical protein